MKTFLKAHKFECLLFGVIILLFGLVLFTHQRMRYTITFDSMGAEGEMEAISGMPDDVIQLPANSLTYEGYRFMGWQDGTKVYEDQATINLAKIKRDLHLKALWEPVHYVVKFNPNGGQGKMDYQEMKYGVVETLQKNSFVKPGYQFAGWSLEKNTGLVSFLDQAQVSNLRIHEDDDITLFAVWTFDESYVQKHLKVASSYLSTTTGYAMLLRFDNQSQTDVRVIVTYEVTKKDKSYVSDVLTIAKGQKMASWTSPDPKVKKITYTLSLEEPASVPELTYKVIKRTKKKLTIKVTNQSDQDKAACQARLLGYKNDQYFFFEQHYSTKVLKPGKSHEFTFKYYRAGIPYTVYLQ